MKNITIDAIDLHLSADDELCIGTLKVFLNQKGVTCIPSIQLEKALSKEECENLQNLIKKKFALISPKPIEIN